MTAAGQRQGPPSSSLGRPSGPTDGKALYTPDAYPPFLTARDADRRACLGTDPEIWFPGDDEDGDNAPGPTNIKRTRTRTAAAKRICGRCRFQARCRAWALTRPRYELYGVWGGTTRTERIQARRGE